MCSALHSGAGRSVHLCAHGAPGCAGRPTYGTLSLFVSVTHCLYLFTIYHPPPPHSSHTLESVLPNGNSSGEWFYTRKLEHRHNAFSTQISVEDGHHLAPSTGECMVYQVMGHVQIVTKYKDISGSLGGAQRKGERFQLYGIQFWK